MKKNIYVDVWGGLGDVVLATPVFKGLKDKFPESRIIAVSSNPVRLQILQNNPYIDRTKIISLGFKLLKYIKLIKEYHIKYGQLKPSCIYTTRASEIIADMLGVKLGDTAAQIYLSEDEEISAQRKLALLNAPVIINITSLTTRNQMWPIERWNELVRAMPEYTFVQLGDANEEKVEGAIDRRGATNVREAMALVKHARGFVGVVSFLSHVTNAFSKPGVVLFGPSAISIWGHPNNINLIKRLPCSPCIDILLNTECPYGRECMTMISVNEVKEAIYRHIPLHK